MKHLAEFRETVKAQYEIVEGPAVVTRKSDSALLTPDEKNALKRLMEFKSVMKDERARMRLEEYLK